MALTAGTESSLIQQGILKLRDNLQNDRKKVGERAILEELNLLSEFARSAAATEAGTAVTRRTLASLKKEVGKFAEKHPEYQEVMDVALQEADRLKGEIDDVLKKQPKAADSALSQIRRGVAALSVISPEVNQTLNTLLMNVEDYATDKERELGKARENVEKWFNDSMDRISGVFKRYSQWMALIIGFIVALLVNVDSVNLTLYLWREPAVREALANNAASFQIPPEQLKANPEQAIENLRNQFIGLSLPVGWVINESTGVATNDDNCRLFPAEKQAFGIPVIGTNKCVAPPESNNRTNVALKLIGILITAVAARQGAPFWFDILKRAVNLRGTGANPIEKK